MSKMSDVANAAGVSIATVSNYLSGKKYVSKEKSIIIQNAIDEMHYEVNLAARSLKLNRSFKIGIVIPEITSIFFSQVFRGMRDAIKGTDYSFIFYDTNYDFKKEQKAIRDLKKDRVDAIIIETSCEYTMQKEWADYLSRKWINEKKMPIVFMEFYTDCKGVSNVYFDNRGLSRMCFKYLLGKNCKNVLYISGDPKTIVGHERIEGFKEGIKEAGKKLDEKYILSGDLSSESGYENVKRAIESGIEFDAVQAVNDQTAVGVLKALKEAKLNVPCDVMLTGCDNLFPATLVSPQITTIDIPAYAIGQESVKAAIKMLDEGVERISKEMPYHLVERRSTNKDCESEWNLSRW